MIEFSKIADALEDLELALLNLGLIIRQTRKSIEKLQEEAEDERPE